MVNLHSQFGWALTRHRDTPRGISVMVFQISSDAEGRPKLNMGWNHLPGCTSHGPRRDQRGSQLITYIHLCFLTVDVMQQPPQAPTAMPSLPPWMYTLKP